jgi:hypothetical protein
MDISRHRKNLPRAQRLKANLSPSFWSKEDGVRSGRPPWPMCTQSSSPPRVAIAAKRLPQGSTGTFSAWYTQHSTYTQYLAYQFRGYLPNIQRTHKHNKLGQYVTIKYSQNKLCSSTPKFPNRLAPTDWFVLLLRRPPKILWEGSRSTVSTNSVPNYCEFV